jgi:hypothetical protein
MGNNSYYVITHRPKDSSYLLDPFSIEKHRFHRLLIKIPIRGGSAMQLVINTPGTFFTQKDECFRLKQKEKVFDISPLKVESIVISNQAMITTQAVVQALSKPVNLEGKGIEKLEVIICGLH